jgi:D-arabinose 5-phosphate isomerase GutQ
MGLIGIVLEMLGFMLETFICFHPGIKVRKKACEKLLYLTNIIYVDI